MTTTTLEKVNMKNLQWEYSIPKTDCLEIKKMSSDEDRPVLKISVEDNISSSTGSDKTDGFVDLEVALRKGKRVGLFKE